ncbi:GGDEF domain-containing protein [Rhodanobacter sp. L36]|uniref:GGDEF domain-containing protein n=1 Tax=Rhodanobacter sp. L36 TaxID=1747221 RepID=UPI00131CE7EE|nr:GGDEF domain-containing protein [Rhodanobacter sp. L36]
MKIMWPRAIVVVVLAAGLIALHLLAVSQRRLDPMALSYGMQVLAPLIAAAVAWWTGRDPHGQLHTRWRLLALAFLLWAVGIGASMCIDVYRTACLVRPGFDTAAYVLYGVPLLLVLTTSPSEWASPLIRWIDAAMVVVLTALILVNALLFAGLMGLNADEALAGNISMYDAENLLLLLFASIRLLASTDGSSRLLYGALAIYTGLYFVAAWYYNHHVVATLHFDTGTRYDVVVDLPFLAFALVALAFDSNGPLSLSVTPRLARFAAAVPSFFLTITVVVIATLTAQYAFRFGISCTILAILGYGIRSTLQQVHHVGATRSAERDRDVMAELAWRDALSGIGNRRAFDAALHLEWARARRTGQNLGLLMIDIDHFKAINDLSGHVAGDDVIRAVGKSLEVSINLSNAVLARYGGEEFACLLPDTSSTEARVIAERMRATVEGPSITHPTSTEGKVTVSIGVASLSVGDDVSVSALVQTADHALYKAKTTGRNCVAD